MANKQTAVDWLYNKLQSECLIDMADEIFNQAKALEKEQISNGYYQGLIDGMNNYPTQYYEETYGK